MERKVTEEDVDAALSRIEALDEEQEETAFEQFVRRQPHVAGLVATVAEELDEETGSLAMGLLFRVEAIFAQARRSPLPTVPEEAVRDGYEKTIAAIEAELGMPEADLMRRVVQPVVMSYVIETLTEPIEDDAGQQITLEEDDLAELIMAFRTVTELFDAQLAA